MRSSASTSLARKNPANWPRQGVLPAADGEFRGFNENAGSGEKLLPSKSDDVGALRAEIDWLKAEGAAASTEIDKIEAERALAPSYDAAQQLEERCRELRWRVEHAPCYCPSLRHA
jgi:hypothetical protein